MPYTYGTDSDARRAQTERRAQPSEIDTPAYDNHKTVAMVIVVLFWAWVIASPVLHLF